MTDSELYENALKFATEKHSGQFRKGGEPYIIHPIAVCGIVKEKGLGIDYQLTALFHDLLEDTDATEEEILSFSNRNVLEAVKLLTKTPGYVMADYVGAIRKNKIAFEVKAADRLHNLQSAVVCSEEFKRRYILETLDWYLDFSKEIKSALLTLAKTLEKPIAELSLNYDPVDDWQL